MTDTSNPEEGVVLIVALGLIVLVSLLALSAIAISQGGHRLSAVEISRCEATYQAESAVSKMIWLLRDDLAKHPKRALGSEGQLDDTGPQYFADGRSYPIPLEDGRTVEVTLSDAASGLDITGNKAISHLRSKRGIYDFDENLSGLYSEFLGAFADYVDRDDLLHSPCGAEAGEYQALGEPALPRNGYLRYVAEICWIPGSGHFFSPDPYGVLSEFRVITPFGLKWIRGRDSFFSASANELRDAAGLSDEELELVLQARSAWQSAQVPLTDNLPLDLTGRLRRHFSFMESGWYTFLVKAPIGGDGGSRILLVTLQVQRGLTRYRRLRYYQWRYLR